MNNYQGEKIMIIIAENYIKPVKLNEVRKMYEKLIHYTRKQPGCISYNLYQDLNNSSSITFVEEWNNEDDLNVHLKDEEFLNIFSNIEKCFAKDEVIKKYELFI